MFDKLTHTLFFLRVTATLTAKEPLYNGLAMKRLYIK